MQTGATSRKQSGRRPLKILLRIVCHFTSERSRSERTGPALLSSRASETNHDVHRFVRRYLWCTHAPTTLGFQRTGHTFASVSRVPPLAPGNIFRAWSTLLSRAPGRVNSTPSARLVTRWDCQGRSARISGPTFRCSALRRWTNPGSGADAPAVSAFGERDPFDRQYVYDRMLRLRSREDRIHGRLLRD